jgi:hypothetical protein
VDVLDLLFRRLVLAARAAGALERPVEIREILDTFAPYGAAKRDGQLDTNDDYLHAVMRLVAGERELLFADDLLQDDFRAELASPNPDLTVVRAYATSKVRIATVRAQEVLGGDIDIDLRPPTPIRNAAVQAPARVSGAAPPMAPKVAPRDEPSSVTEPRGPGAPFVPETIAPSVDPTPAVAPAEAAIATAAPGCPYCAQPLPEGRPLKFCPSCGQNLLVRRCSGCSAEIESGWKFCVTCGRKA